MRGVAGGSVSDSHASAASHRSMHAGGLTDRVNLSVMSDQELTDYMKEHFRWFVGMMDRAQVQ